MSRPSKPPLTAEEWEAIAGLGNMEAAGQVSLMRGAGLGSITQAEARRRRVSHDWILIQRRKTQPTKNPDFHPRREPTKNIIPFAPSGPRTGYESPTGVAAVQESTPISERNTEPGTKPSQIQVESEQPGAT